MSETFKPEGSPAPPSSTHAAFPAPILSSNNGFDFHIYYHTDVAAEAQHARTLLRIYRFWDRPVGPHRTPMFEVNMFTPHQTGALFSWLAVNRGPCSLVSLKFKFNLQFYPQRPHPPEHARRARGSHDPRDVDGARAPPQDRHIRPQAQGGVSWRATTPGRCGVGERFNGRDPTLTNGGQS
ncbi:hypothetical protein DFH07DRAFT_810657, partial [Mycena maculata]